MRAVILAGGLGTRLRPYTTVIPKPLVPIGGRPIVEHIIVALYRRGVRKVDLCVGRLGNLIRLYLIEAALPEDLELVFHREDEPLGTAGALRTVTDLGGPFIAMNGDVLTTLNYAALMRHHEESGAALTIAMHRKGIGIDLGVLESNAGIVTDYIEKPTLHYDVSMGIYVYGMRALAHLPDGPCQFPDLVMRLLEAGERVATFPNDAEWYDIGTVAEYERASLAFEQAPEKFEM